MLGYEIAAESRVLGMYKQIQQSANTYLKNSGTSQVPPQLVGSGKMNEIQLQNEYNHLVKNKDMEINRQHKSLIKESLRISYKELGQIHYNNGFTQEAYKSWLQSFEMSISDEDSFHMSIFIAKSAFQTKQGYLVGKFSDEAMHRDTKKNVELSALVRILDGLHTL